MIPPTLKRRTALLAALQVFMAGCSPEPSTAPVAPATASHAGVAGDGLVWRVTGGKTTFFLAGSFHLLRAGDYPLPEPYETAWRESTHLVLEIPPGDSQQAASAGSIKNLIQLKSGTLAERITPATWEDLCAWAGKWSYPVKSLETMTPWMAGLTIAVTTSAQVGFKSEHGIERHFTARLPGSGKTTEGLETTLGQLSLFAEIAPAQQEAMLRQALAESHILSEKADTLTHAWRTGNATTLHASISESFAGFADLKKLLLDDRNAAWVPRLESLLQGDRPVMVLVGAGHLCGPGSVIDLLEAKGYRCIKLKSAAPAGINKAA